MTNEELKQRLITLYEECMILWHDNANIPTIVEHLIANGVTIRERGEWITIFNDSYCSVCCCKNNADTVTRVRDESPFFPNCGADMRGDAN